MASTLKPSRAMLYVDAKDWSELSDYAKANGISSANQLLAIAGHELAEAKRKGLNLWQVIGRIAADESEPERKRLPGSRPALEATAR